MADSPLNQSGEIFLTSTQTSSQVSRAVRQGRARKLAGRLYTTNLSEEPEAIMSRNLWQAVSLLFPDAVVSHRTALEMKPSPRGTVFLTGAYDRIVELPGLRVRMMRGPGNLPGDTPFLQRMWKGSEARAFLECLRTRRVRGLDPQSLPRAELEGRLERIAGRGGEALNRLRDLAQEIAPALDTEAAQQELDRLVGALLGTRQASLSDPGARARAAGEPYDVGRMQMFGVLYEALIEWPSASRPDPVTTGPAWEHLAFLDAYFSNFIEGTEFLVGEAVAIVYEHRMPENRPEDAHDVLGTYRLVSSAEEMRRSVLQYSHDFDGFLSLLKSHHAAIMEARPTKRPGEFKQESNRAGLTFFVEPSLVVGTLRKGFEMLRSLSDPFHRATFLMFLITEVHPFDDGNGRTARVLMNAELISGGERRIFIPTAYRQDYIGSLKALSRDDRPGPFIRMLDRAQRFSASIDTTDLEQALSVLEEAHAFDSDEDSHLRDR